MSADRLTFTLPDGGTVTVTAGTRSAVTLARCYPHTSEPETTETVKAPEPVEDMCVDCDGDCGVCEA